MKRKYERFKLILSCFIIYSTCFFSLTGESLALAIDGTCMAEDSLCGGILLQFTITDGCYMPRDVNIGGLDYAFFLYFITDSIGHEPQLRLYIQYCADDPLHYYEIIFFIDGNEYPFMPVKPKLTKIKGRYFLETSDTEVQEADKRLIDALMNNHSIELKLKGAGGMGHVIPLTDRQCQSFINSIRLYRSMGGKL